MSVMLTWSKMLGSCLSDVYASILITSCSIDPINSERRVRTARMIRGMAWFPQESKKSTTRRKGV